MTQKYNTEIQHKNMTHKIQHEKYNTKIQHRKTTHLFLNTHTTQTRLYNTGNTLSFKPKKSEKKRLQKGNMQ